MGVVGKAWLAISALACSLLAFYAAGLPPELESAVALIRSGQFQQAEQAIDKHLAAAEPHPRASYWKAYVQFATRRYGESAAVLREYVTLNPEDAQARKLFGLDLFMMGDAAAAEAELERAVAALPKDEESRYYLGRVYFTRQNMPSALAAFQRVIEVDPGSVRGHNQLGQTYEALADFEKAQQSYETAIELDRTASKRSEWPHYNLGVLQLKAGKGRDAIPHFNEALRIQRAFPEARVQRASALASVGEIKQARADLEALLAEQPEYADAHYQLGRLLAKTGEREKAKEHLSKFQRLRSK